MPRLSTRPTMRSIATVAGVSPMTVSLALRGDRSVSAKTAKRIRVIAGKQGYRPDPLLTHLMEHLRSSRTARSTANLAIIATLDAEFTRRLIAGATRRASRLGYVLDPIDIKPYANKRDALTRMLLARGIAGILIAPSSQPTDFTGLLDWNRFAAVAMTYSVFAPRVHRVVTHHYDNATRVFGRLYDRGFRRIGLAMTEDMAFRANHSYDGAYARMQSSAGLTRMPILYLDRIEPRGIRMWFDRHRPDTIVVANSTHVADALAPALGARRVGRVVFVSLDNDLDSKLSGIDQLFEIIGSHAVDNVVAQVHRNDRGLPEHPMISMVEGQWIDRAHLQCRPARAITESRRTK